MIKQERAHHWIVLLALCGSLVLEAVVSAGAFAGARSPHPQGLYSKWLNRTVSELVGAYGEPDDILETAVRGFVVYGDMPSVMYIYASNPEFGGGCVAAYVIELDTGRILRYQCR